MEEIKFLFSYYGDGVMLQETDEVESYFLQHGPYANTQVAFDAMLKILEEKPPVKEAA